MEPEQQQFSIGYVVVALLLLMMVRAVFFAPHAENLPYSDFKKLAAEGKVSELTLTRETLTGTLAAKGLETVLPAEKIFSYPWLCPVLRDWFPRGSPQVWYIWAAMGVASFAVLLYSGNQFFTGAWQALKHRSANMHSLIAMGTGIAWVYSTIALLFPQISRSTSDSRWRRR